VGHGGSPPRVKVWCVLEEMTLTQSWMGRVKTRLSGGERGREGVNKSEGGMPGLGEGLNIERRTECGTDRCRPGGRENGGWECGRGMGRGSALNPGDGARKERKRGIRQAI